MSAEKETYVRRRAYNKIHVTSWLIYLEKDGFVRCPFQNCNFMAFDVNEMCDHYGYCKGDSSSAKFVCEVCKGCTVSEKKLQEHRSRAHNITILPEQASPNVETDDADPGKPSRVLMLSWSFFFDKHNYIKCSNCQYISNTMSDMCHHYLVCKQEKKNLRYVCPVCKGRAQDVAPLIVHLERAHKITKRADQFNHISRNMVQFWEKELREEKYATCLHINAEKERDCHYIDVDLLGINEHSQTCKGPLHKVTTSKQWFCQFCKKWTGSENKLNRHELLSHYNLYPAISVGQNDQSNCPVAGAQTIKQEVRNTSRETVHPKQYSSGNKFVAFRSKKTTDSSVKKYKDPVKPFETVFIVKQEYNAENSKEIQNTVGKGNIFYDSHPNYLKNGSNSEPNLSYVAGSVKKSSLESSIQRNALSEPSNFIKSVNTNQQPIGLEASSSTVGNLDQANQEIFLDLVEDKLVARKSLDEIEGSTDSINNQLKEKVSERLDPSVNKCQLSTNKNHKQFKEQAIEIIDVAENEFATSLCVSNKSNKCTELREPAVIKIEEEFGFDEEYEVDDISNVESSMSSRRICDDSSKLFKDDEIDSIRENPFETVSQELHRIKTVGVVTVKNESSTGAKDHGEEKCQKEENVQLDGEEKAKKVCNTIKTNHYNLFKDDFSSDEEDCTKMYEKGTEKEDKIKVTSNWRSENKLYAVNKPPQKSYSRKKCTDGNTEGCSPAKFVNNLCNQNSKLASPGNCFSDVKEIENTRHLAHKGRKSCDNHYKTDVQVKSSLVLENRIRNFDNLQEEASKNSEKNDKLMLQENSGTVLSNGYSSLGEENKIVKTHENDTNLEVEMLSTSEHSFKQTAKTDAIKLIEDSKEESSCSIRFGCSKTFTGECSKPKCVQKLQFKTKSETNNGALLTEAVCRQNEKMTQNSSLRMEETVQSNSNKSKDFIYLQDDYQNSLEESKFLSECSSLSKTSLISPKINGMAVDAVEANDKVSSEPKIVSFFYSGRLKKPVLAGHSSNNEKSIEDTEKIMNESLFGNNSMLLANKRSSLTNHAIDTASLDSVEEEKNSTGNAGVESATKIQHLDSSSIDSDMKLDVVSRIQADFLVDSSSDEETSENKVTVRSGNQQIGSLRVEANESSFGVETCTNPVKDQITTIPVETDSSLNTEPLEESETEMNNLEVRRISSDFYEESSLDEEDFLGTDEELDMKDQFFNGFQEISETMNSKSTQFRQFLNRLSESENEEWYVNAGNLSMEVRKDASLSHSKSKNLKKKSKCNTLNSFGEEMTVIVMDDNSNDQEHAVSKPQEELVNVGITNMESKSKRGNEIKSRGLHNKYIHKKGFMGDKFNKNIKMEMPSTNRENENVNNKELLTTNIVNKSTESLKISLNIDKLKITCKSGNDTVRLQPTKEDNVSKMAERFKLNSNNDSVGSIVHRKELDNTIEEGLAIIDDSTISSKHKSNQEDKINVMPAAVERRKSDPLSINNVKPLIMNQINKHCEELNTLDHSRNGLKANKSLPDSEKNQIQTVITKNSQFNSLKLASDDNASLDQIVEKPENPPEATSSPINQFMPEPNNSNKNVSSICRGELGQLVCSTPLKTKEIILDRAPGSCNSLLPREDEEKLNSKLDSTIYSDEESSSIVQKACQSSIKTVLSTKDNLLTEGFSPHDNAQEKIPEEHRFEENKQNHLSTSIPVIESEQNNKNSASSSEISPEKVDTVNCKATKIAKKRGRKPKRILPEIKVENSTSNDESEDINNATLSKIQKREEITLNSLSENDVGECNTSEMQEVNSIALASENSVEPESGRLPEISVQKKRGRPPKRRQEMNISSSQSDPNSFDDLSSDNELLLSIYSEEIESILGGEFCDRRTYKDRQDKLVGCVSESTAKQSITLPTNSEIKVYKKRGRKPKQKLDSSVSEYTKPNSSTVAQDNANCQNMVETNLSAEKLCDITTTTTVPKKRGRKPKLKIENISSECSLKTANLPISDDVFQENHTQCNEVMDFSAEKNCDSGEIKVPKKRGRKPKLKFESISSECTLNTANSSISEDVFQEDDAKCQYVKDIAAEKLCDSGEIKVPKKRGRKPKLKLESNNSECTPNSTNSSVIEEIGQNDGTESTDRVNTSITNESCNSDIIEVPKKRRGRPPKSQSENLLNISSSAIQSEKNEGEVSLPKKRGRKPASQAKLNSTQEPTDLESEVGSKRRKLNSDINDTSSEVSNIADVDSNSSVTGELLGTDVILINKEKFNSSHSSHKRFRKCKVKPMNLEVSDDDDDDDDSDRFEPEALLGSDDTDEDVSYGVPSQSKKHKKVESDAAMSSGKKGGQKIFFKAIHRPEDKVVCGACKEEMTYSAYKTRHAVTKHYMLSWLEGEEDPVDMSNQKDVENRLWFAKKRMGKTPFYCPVCRLPKLSAVGYYSHILFCGKDNKEKESLLVTCELCGAKLMPSSLRAHMNQKHTAKPQEEEKKKNTEEPVVKGPRAAATRAVEVMQQSQVDFEDGEGGSRSNSPERKAHLSHLYVRPNKVVPPSEFKRWKDSLALTKKATCPIPACDFTGDSTIAIRKHYMSCPLAPPRLFKCRLCFYTSATKEPMLQHVEEHHDENFTLNLQSSESSDESDGDGEHEHKTTRAPYASSTLPFKFLKNIKPNRSRHHLIRKKFFTAALTWTLNLRKRMQTPEPLYTEVRPDPDGGSRLDEASPHLPELRESVRFRGSDGAWRTLRRFHSCTLDGAAMLFAGGPVWATAWAPVPHPEEHQYLAVATHTSAEETHTMASLYNYPGLIQIWSVGPLRHFQDVQGNPRLVVGLAQQRGPVWGLAWCPAGAYTQDRLGLLAAACGDGSVVVYAVPHDIPSDGDPVTRCWTVKPQWELRLGCEMMSQCTCVDWHSAAPHSVIAGGFANGMIALWDLNTTSPLLKSESTILPFKVIEAHLSAVIAVQLSCNKEMSHMMSSSLDRATKFWRLDDSTTVVNSLRKASATDAVMTNHWLMSITAYDDVYSINSSHVTGYPYRETFMSSNCNFILQPGTVWGLSFNDWLNGCACASEMGRVNAFFRQQLLVSEDSKKIHKNAVIEDLILCSARSIQDGSPVTCGFGRMYNDCASTIGLEFNFGGNIKVPKQASACSSNNMDSYPIRSFNTVSWNPNIGSFTWLAAGMQCGLVVIPRMGSVCPDDLTELLNHQDYR